MFRHLRAGSGADLATNHATQFATRIPGERTSSRPVFAFVVEDTRRATGPRHGGAMQPTEAQNRQTAQSWSVEEELTITTIQQTESVPRAEAIRRMQRRKRISTMTNDRAPLRRAVIRAAGRMCRNPRCTGGEDYGPGSLAHLRADALYCNATCKKAGQRSLNRENRASNRQCLRGSKGDKFISVAHPTTPMNVLSKSPAIAISRFGYVDSRAGR
jgi:hypothetical protein